MRAFYLSASLFSLVVIGVPVRAADVEASFLRPRVYTTAQDCQLHKKIAAGGQRSLTTVPETLTATGYASWEGGCRFTNIVERYQGRIWTVSMMCGEGATENQPRTEVWRRQPDGSLTVTRDKASTTMIACATEKPPQPASKKK